MDVDDILTKHEIRETIQLPHKSFPDYVISQFYSKLVVQSFGIFWNLRQIHDYSYLKKKIERCIKEIQPHLCKTIMENFKIKNFKFQNQEELKECINV